MDAIHQTALFALESAIRGVLGCQVWDDLELTTSIVDGLPHLTGFSVTRCSPQTVTECTLCFGDDNFIDHQGKLIPIGNYFISAANVFLDEVLTPRLGRKRGAGMEKLIAGAREINLETAFSSAAGHVETT